MKVVDEFRKFAMRGSVIDLAVGVVVGAAFTAIVNSLQLTGSGRTVALSFAVPSELLDMIPNMKKDGGQLHELPKELHQRH